MRRLIFILLVIALGWMGYWAVGAIALERGLVRWFEAREADGWIAHQGGVEISGFPVRFEVRIEAPELADPETGLAWSAEAFRFNAASHRPTEITAIWPEDQTLATPFERIAIRAEVMQGLVGFQPNTALALRRADIAMRAVDLASTAGWTGGLASAQLTVLPSDHGPYAHRVDFDAVDLRLAEAVKDRLDPAGILPREIALMELAADIAFTAPWDRAAIEEARPQITALDLENLRARWGDLDLRAAGALSVDGAGLPTGRITVKAVNWREMVGIARSSGVLPEALAPTLERALEILAGLSGPPDTLDAPLSFRDGFVSFGPIPLGPAPRLVIR